MFFDIIHKRIKSIGKSKSELCSNCHKLTPIKGIGLCKECICVVNDCIIVKYSSKTNKCIEHSNVCKVCRKLFDINDKSFSTEYKICDDCSCDKMHCYIKKYLFKKSNYCDIHSKMCYKCRKMKCHMDFFNRYNFNDICKECKCEVDRCSRRKYLPKINNRCLDCSNRCHETICNKLAFDKKYCDEHICKQCDDIRIANKEHCLKCLIKFKKNAILS